MRTRAADENKGRTGLTSPDVVDVHAHLLPPGYAQAIRAGDLDQALSPTLAAAMTGQATGSCAPRTPTLRPWTPPGWGRRCCQCCPLGGAQLAIRGFAARIAAEANDELLQIAEQHRLRFGAVLALPFPHVAESCANSPVSAGMLSPSGLESSRHPSPGPSRTACWSRSTPQSASSSLGASTTRPVAPISMPLGISMSRRRQESAPPP